MLKVHVGDVVEMNDPHIPNQRVVGVYPMNHIPTPDRIDVVDALDLADHPYCGIPLNWVKQIIKPARQKREKGKQ